MQAITIQAAVWTAGSRKIHMFIATMVYFSAHQAEIRQVWSMARPEVPGHYSPERSSPTSPPFFSTALLAAPMVAYSGPQIAIALRVPKKKGRNGRDDSPNK
jgi:hypothetical protein